MQDMIVNVDQRIYYDLLVMLQTAKSEGLNLLVCSSYRTNDKQAQLYLNKVNEYLKQGYSKMAASDKVAVWVARQKTSEHQLGFAEMCIRDRYLSIFNKFIRRR